ncbi:MAG: stage II sporulation protein M [Planctomycetota bacterium]
MSRQSFVASRRKAWDEFTGKVGKLSRTLGHLEPEEAASFPSEYRRMCQDLTLARHRRYGLAIAGRLNDLVLEGYHALHGHRRSPLLGAGRFLFVEFPREVRQYRGLLWLCITLFFGPFLLLTLAGVVAPEWVYAAIGPEMRAQLDSSFGSGIDPRGANSDVQMFGFYVWNNVGIDFRTFAGGILYGIGTLFFLVFNGVVLGGAFGYALHAGHTEHFFAFTAGHGSLELTAVVISGMAGLKLAQGLVAPGRMRRGHALRVRAREGVRLIAGAAAMTVGAAFVEAFWSASAVPAGVKYVVGACGWVAVILFFVFGGRRAS